MSAHGPVDPSTPLDSGYPGLLCPSTWVWDPHGQSEALSEWGEHLVEEKKHLSCFCVTFQSSLGCCLSLLASTEYQYRLTPSLQGGCQDLWAWLWMNPRQYDTPSLSSHCSAPGLLDRLQVITRQGMQSPWKWIVSAVTAAARKVWPRAAYICCMIYRGCWVSGLNLILVLII